MQIIQRELNQIRMDWNQHRVRESRGTDDPAGKPDLMFFTPELYGNKVMILSKTMLSVKFLYPY